MRQSTPDEYISTFEPLRKPVKNASHFYLLHYLTEFRDVDGLKKDFKDLTNDLYVAFKNYSIYTMFAEATHANTNFRINHKEPDSDNTPGRGHLFKTKLEQYVDRWGESFPREVRQGDALDKDLSQTLSKGIVPDLWDATMLYILSTFDDPWYTYDFLMRTSETNNGVGMVRHYVEQMLEMGIIGKGDGYMEGSNQSQFLNMARNLFSEKFGHDDRTPLRVPDPRIEYVTGSWMNNYNGEAYRGVIRHHTRELSPTGWVDQSWSIQHNTNNWLKDAIVSRYGFTAQNFDVQIKPEVPPVPEETIEAYDTLTGSSLSQDGPDRDNVGWGSDQTVNIFVQPLQALLDAVHNGDMEKVAEVATLYNSEVPYNTRRLWNYL